MPRESAAPTIVVRPAAPRRLSSGRYTITGARESWDAGRRERQAKTLAMLRVAFAEGEEALVGWPAIVLYLHRLGVRNAYGKQVTAAAIRRWRDRFDFPILPGRWKRTPPLSSSYLILAWLVNLLRSGERDGLTVSKGNAEPRIDLGSTSSDCDSRSAESSLRAEGAARLIERQGSAGGA
jgi:hypothetical protein